jgi:hypothetical protein
MPLLFGCNDRHAAQWEWNVTATKDVTASLRTSHDHVAFPGIAVTF